jgi:hypothetical protein
VGGVAGCICGGVALLVESQTLWFWILIALWLGPSSGLAMAYLRPRRLREAAVTIDRHQGLKDSIATAMQFMTSTTPTPIHQLQIEDASQRAQSIDPVKIAPIVAPRCWLPGIALTCLAACVALLVAGPDEAVANPVVNEVVASQASRIDNSLKELEEFNRRELDPEIEELLQELAQKIEELRQPQMDPKEALAKLSEMEAALQEQQEKLNQQDTQAALQQVGEALTLAEQMQAAGAAMAKGDMEKAAEELEKLEMPELDRKTEKSITEKLQRVENESSGAAMKQLKSAVQKISQGLGNGDRSKFREGVQGLAGECNKQGRRKKLTDLLRKQCRCLGECKSECEGACKSTDDSNKKGGKNWGLAASGNQPGDKSSQLSLSPKMDIKGKESEQGDVDVETISAQQQSQEAVRTYRQQVEKYEQLTESVLSSEPIPLGHRQTIRRYFELIRPQAGETDAVLKENESE